MNELKGKRKEEFNASRKKLGVRERTFYQQTPMGGLVLVTLEGNDPAKAFAKFAQGNDEFTKWFMENVQNLHGVDLSQPPPEDTIPQMIIDSEE
jgi:hypothetical protein